MGLRVVAFALAGLLVSTTLWLAAARIIAATLFIAGAALVARSL